MGPFRAFYRGISCIRPDAVDTSRRVCTVCYRNPIIHSQTSSTSQYPSRIQQILVRGLLKQRKNPAQVAVPSLKDDSIKIQLFGVSNELMSVVTLRNAKKMAKEQGLKLAEIDLSAKPHPTYQLMTGKELHAHQVQQRESKTSKKSEKTLRFASKISAHDLEIKLKNTKDHLQKGHKVRTIVLGPKNASPEETGREHSRLLKLLTEELGDMAVVQQAAESPRELVVVFKPKQTDEGDGNV